MLLCNRCFKTEGECKCENNHFVDIDDDFVKHIQLLNQKGYKTTNCCSGHIDDIWFRPYVTFEKNYKFSNPPYYFQYDRKHKGFYYIFKWENIDDMDYRKSIMKLAQESFLEWIKALPDAEEL